MPQQLGLCGHWWRLWRVAFYASYPGEQKTLWEAFYFSLQTLTTVGFGDVYPVTRGGRAFATVWMLLGVTAAANTIVTLTDAILKYRKELKADNLSKELLLQMSRDGSGKVQKMDFLCYELVRRGLCDSDDLSDILNLFLQLDHEGAGFLRAEDLCNMRPKRSA
ncbi:TPKB [Symbiodinium pilosum]|uniref:TPKB protein n=1 Tax=Symbiodinium pilosum TaxID=2952 RepID=A0A812S392_SYMPI|nr:TPKB [Symbiodinium pilosum]